MRLLLCVHGSDENCPSSSFVLLTIAPEYARQMLQRREIVRQIDGRSEELGTLWALSFWDATPRWVGHDPEVEASPEFARSWPPARSATTWRTSCAPAWATRS